MNIFLFPKSTAFYPIVWVLSTKSKHQFQSSSIHKTECSKIHHTHTTLKIESSLVFSICESLFKRSNTRWSKPISCINLCFKQQQRITHELKALQLDKGGWYSDLKQKHFPLLKAKINLHKETEQEAKHSTKQVWHPTVNEICLKKKKPHTAKLPKSCRKKKSHPLVVISAYLASQTTCWTEVCLCWIAREANPTRRPAPVPDVRLPRLSKCQSSGAARLTRGNFTQCLL